MNFEQIIAQLNDIVWGIPMLALLLGTGLYLTVSLKFLPVRKLGFAFSELFRKRTGQSDGEVSPFGALMTALSSTIGTGNIGGVAAAIAIGGPGAVFWMWMTAIVGTATKYSEGLLALRFRETDANGNHVGGPMYYIKNGMGQKWIWLAGLFATFGIFGAWGTGAMVQSNSIADGLNAAYGINPFVTAAVLSAAAAAVILGGVKRIAGVASKLVPFMAATYLIAGLIVIALNISAVPAAFGAIFRGAFGLDSAGTGISIGLLMLAMQRGVARGIFSNEAGQGSAPIAHAAAKNKDPVNQGIVAMLGTIIDTLIICTLTALVILTSGVVADVCQPTAETLSQFLENDRPEQCLIAVPLTAAAFDATLTGVGEHIVSISLVIFAFTTILGWSYYGERCCAFLFSEKAIFPFRLSWIAVVFGGASLVAFKDDITNIIELVWLVADTLTGMMAAPNLVALIILSPVVFTMTREYFKARDAAAKEAGDSSEAPAE
ncbi:MAG: alanine/glycine:cation symporter family protein [Pseudomonadota bacterium]